MLYVLTEENDWEGETWWFFIEMDDYSADVLYSLVAHVGGGYSLCPCPLTEDAARALAGSSMNRAGYMHAFTFVGPVDVSSLADATCAEAQEKLYKGGIRDFAI